MDDSQFIDKFTDWTLAKMQAEWWIREQHLHMLSKDYSIMDDYTWNECPSDTNSYCRKKE